MDGREQLIDQAAVVGASIPMLTALGDVARDEDLWVLAIRTRRSSLLNAD